MRRVQLLSPKVRSYGKDERTRAARAVAAEQRARKAQSNLEEMLGRIDGRLLGKNANAVLGAGPRMLKIVMESAESKNWREKKWAVEVFMRLLVALTGRQMAAEPPRKREARAVEIREWPTEGAKS